MESFEEMNKNNIAKEEDDDNVLDHFKKKSPWGMSVSIDIYDCQLELIDDEKTIRLFLQKLIEFIKMKAYGEPLMKKFGPSTRLYGYSVMQLIETSNVTVHFSPATKAAYIDIFSCKEFKPHATGMFCKEFFKAKKMIVSKTNFRY
jgi:S-adenosylmethionine/arginine decarboxylase-like enzyme